MKKMSTKMVVTLGFLVAIEIILSRFLSINAWNIKIGFKFVPVAIAAIMFGPLAAGIVGALGDFLGAILFPIGAYFPGFTATAFVIGIVTGLFIHKKTTIPRIIVAVAINQFILGLFVNSLWISILYGSPYIPLLATRIIQCLVLFPVQACGIYAICQILNRVGNVIYDEQ